MRRLYYTRRLLAMAGMADTLRIGLAKMAEAKQQKGEPNGLVNA